MRLRNLVQKMYSRMIYMELKQVEQRIIQYAHDEFLAPVIDEGCIRTIPRGGIIFESDTGSVHQVHIGPEYRGPRRIAERIITIAHELGHARDLWLNYNCKLNDYGVHSEEYGIIIQAEIDAWLYAIDILDEVGFTAWQALEPMLDDNLRSYFYSYDEDNYLSAKYRIISKAKLIQQRNEDAHAMA